SVQEGAQVYEVRCKECHGESGAGGDHAALVGNPEQLKQAPPIKTVGSFWPYATTLFDYTRRAMPFEEPGTLRADQLYAVTAYVLHINGIVDEDATLDRESLPKVEMPTPGGFVRDPRSKP
ncbi:MAG: cytochrome c, partial [Spirochaetaceae bacterium]|nr:cytochrome c [Spirochaetaceae bacterium]